MDSSNLVNVKLVNINDSDMYIDEEQNEATDENVLKSLSWFDSVEQELSSSIDTKVFVNEQKTDCLLNANDLLSEKIDCLTDINIMEYQTIIVNNLRKEFKLYDDKVTDKIDTDNLLLKLNWLFETSKYLSDKLGLVIIQHKVTDPNILLRSSYKFCDNNFECEYNYNTKKHYGCFARHYVHNLVNADISALQHYIIHKKMILNDMAINEIKKSINTISFVIGHMYEELKNAQTFNFFNSKNIHIERNPKKKKAIRKQTN